MVSGEIGPEQVLETVEWARTCRTEAARSLLLSLWEGAAGSSLAALASANGFVVAVGLAVPLAGLAAVALPVAADAAGAATSPMTVRAAITMAARFVICTATPAAGLWAYSSNVLRY